MGKQMKMCCEGNGGKIDAVANSDPDSSNLSEGAFLATGYCQVR